MIKNISKKTVLARKKKFCRNFLNRSIGLILHKKLKDKALIFVFKKEKKVPLHMVFVFFHIDVLFLDKNKKVIEMLERFRPFSYYTPNKKSCYIIELPENTIKKTKTSIGNKIIF